MYTHFFLFKKIENKVFATFLAVLKNKITFKWTKIREASEF